MELSKTLHAALHQMRGSKRSKLDYVGVLSINQSDDKERNKQISKMRAVYSQAAHVVV